VDLLLTRPDARNPKLRSFFSRLGDCHLQLVGPIGTSASAITCKEQNEPDLQRATLEEMQRFRGKVYLDNQVIPAQALDERGRHFSAFDFVCWHFLMRKGDGRLCGCIRARLHTVGNDCDDFALHEMINRLEANQKRRYANAVQSFLENAYRQERPLLEVGGWAVDRGFRNSMAAPLLTLACYALAQLLGNCLVLASAGNVNGSANILRRFGGLPLQEGESNLPSFFDAHHNCDIDILAFDCFLIPPKYQATVDEVRRFLRQSRVLISP
jgi:predicted GNAT family N-acyltransferase